MTYVCAWCGGELPEMQENGGERVSHGICIPCALKELPEHLHVEFLCKREVANALEHLPPHLHGEYLRRKQLEREGFTVSADRVAMGRCF